MFVDLFVTIMKAIASVAIMQLEISATLMQVKISPENMWVTTFIEIMQVAIKQVAICCNHACVIFYSALIT